PAICEQVEPTTAAIVVSMVIGGGGWQASEVVGGVHWSGGNGVEVTGPLNTCCGCVMSLAHIACAWVVQLDTHRAVAQSRLHDVVHAEIQFFTASLSAPAFPAAKRHNANAIPASFRIIQGPLRISRGEEGYSITPNQINMRQRPTSPYGA